MRRTELSSLKACVALALAVFTSAPALGAASPTEPTAKVAQAPAKAQTPAKPSAAAASATALQNGKVAHTPAKAHAPAKRPPAAPSVAASSTFSFFTLAPCRVFDSRQPAGAPALQTGAARAIQVTGTCGVPADAKVVAVNATVTQSSSSGSIELFPGDGTATGMAQIDFAAGQTRANNAVVSLAGDGSGGLKALLSTTAPAQSADLIVDVSGYFKPGAPVAVDDSYTTTFNTDLDQAAPGVLANDTPNGAPIVSYGATTGAEQTSIGTATPTSAAGSITLNADGSFSYTPPTGFKGDDTFKYVLQNAAGSSTATVTISVGKGNQTINFTSTPPVGATVGGPTYTVTATASSGLTVAFSIDASAASVCTISGSTVSFIGVGTCVIDADQPGDANYNPAPQVQQSDPVGQGSQTITFTSTPPAGAKVGGPTYTVTATASSGLAVTLSIDASATSVCSISGSTSGSTVSFIGVGTCVIDANQAGDANYSAAPQVQQTDPVGKGDQTITFTSTPPPGATVGGPTYTVTATASSGLPVVLSIDALATSVCSISGSASGSTVSFTATGTCVIDANQAGDATYNAAPQKQQTDPVDKSDQTITFTSTPPAGAKVGGPTYTVTATASSGLAVVLTIDASATSVCSISGSVSGSAVSFIGAGTCVIDANQAGDANYNAAPQKQQTDPVAKGDQTITFTSTPPAGAKVGGPTYTVTATASSGLPVVLTIDASATSVCSISGSVSGSTVSFVGVGTCVIDANQAGNANYNAAPQAQQSDPVAKGDQTITFTSTPPAGAKVGGPTYTVTATASSGLAVTLTIDASASSVCSISGSVSGSTVSFIGAGTCVIDANQAGNANYNAAPQAQQTDPVAKGDQTITFTSTPPAGAKVGGPTYTVSATSSAGLTVTFTIDASAASVCSISGSTVSFIGAGTCVIDANQAGNANYNAAPQVQQTDPVAKGDQTITFTSTAPAGAKVGGPTYTVTATATSGLAVTFTIDASATSVCSISGSTVSFIGAGTCVIDAHQAGNANYNAAPQVQQPFQVNQSPTITSANSTIFHATQFGTFTVTATGTPTVGSISATGTLPSGVTFVNNGNGTATLSGTAAAGAQTNSPYTLNITADNGVPPPATQTFTLNIPNIPPTPIASPKETFDTVGNTQLEFKAAKALPVSIFVAGNLVANFTDPDGPNPLSAVAIVAGATTNGGKVDLATNGEFTFTPKAGDAAASDSFNYQVTDGMDTVTRTVTINFKSRVWYVKNNSAAGGLGRSNDPFDTLAEAQTASVAGDYIFVYGGDGTTTGQAAGITLQANQKLYGEAFGLTVANTVNGVVNPTLVAANAANRPLIDNTAATSDGVTALNISGVEVRGLSIGATQHAVNVSTTATNSGGATITDNVIRQPGSGDGIRVTGGGTGTMTVAIQSNTITGNLNGINVQKTAGTLYITAFNDNTVTGTTPGNGINVGGAIFDAVPGGSIQTVSGGATAIGVSGNGVGASGMLLANVVGDLSFTSFGLYNDAGTGLLVSSTGALNAGAGTGFRVVVGAGVGTIDSNGGPALNVSNASVTLPLNFLRSLNSTTTGVSLVNAFGGVGSTAFSVSSGQITDPSGASGTAFNLSGGTGNVTVGIPITNSSGNSVAVASRTSDTVTFSSTIGDTGSGISLTSNTGATINFTGALTLSTGANAAFSATGGGTVTATDTTSTATTTTGTAVNVANTTIGAAGLKFKSVSAGTAASGPASGIVLNTTGSSGGLTVSGTGSAGSGGTIQKTTSHGISLTSTANVNLSWLNVSNSGADGIMGSSVNGFSLDHSTISDSAGSNTTDDGLHLGNSTGTVSITTDSITGSPHQGITIDNLNTNMASLTLTGTTVSGTTGGDGMLMQMRGTSVLTTGTISGDTFSNNSATGLQVSNADTGNIQGLTVQNNTVSGNNAGMDFDLSQGSSMTVNVLTNTFNNHKAVSLNVFSASTATGGTLTAKLQGNTIGTTGTLDSGGGTGIRVITQNANKGAFTIDTNQIHEVPNGFGMDIESIGHTSGNSVKVKVTGNTVTRPTGTNVNVGCGTFAPCPESSIFVSSDTDSASESVCTVISGNTAYDPTSWPQGAGFAAYYLARRGPTPQVLNLEGNTSQSPRTNILGDNTVTNFNSGDFIDESGNVTVVSAGTCGSFP